MLTAIATVATFGHDCRRKSRLNSSAAKNCLLATALRVMQSAEAETARIKLAPTFRSLGQRYPMKSLEEALGEGIMSGHPDMPNSRLTQADVGAIIAYLKFHPATLEFSAQPESKPLMPSTLFTPFRLAGLELANRIVVSPMCQYSADDGCANDWHLMHLGMLAHSGAALVIVEATHVERHGRIHMGVWASIPMITRPHWRA